MSIAWLEKKRAKYYSDYMKKYRRLKEERKKLSESERKKRGAFRVFLDSDTPFEKWLMGKAKEEGED